MSLWNIFGGRGKEAEQESENAPPFGIGAVDMTTLDITYITHRLLGESVMYRTRRQTAGRRESSLRAVLFVSAARRQPQCLVCTCCGLTRRTHNQALRVERHDAGLRGAERSSRHRCV